MNFPIHLTDEKIEYFHQLLSPDMTDFNCGELCAPKNNGQPFCCDSKNVIPLLYRDEMRWDKQHGDGIWRMLYGEEIAELDLPLCVDPEVEVYAVCTCAPNCPRDKRALICRTFPFLPYFNENGKLEGLTYNFFEEGKCPLVGRADITLNPEYVKNACIFWQEILEIFPDDKELYIYESADRRRIFAEHGKELPIFRPPSE